MKSINVETTWKTKTLQSSGCFYETDDLAWRKLVSKDNRNLKEAVKMYGSDWTLPTYYNLSFRVGIQDRNYLFQQITSKLIHI